MENRLVRLEDEVNSLEDEVNSLKTRLAVAESSIKEINEDVSNIKDNTTWTLRLVIGGLIGGVISFIFSGGFNI